ncbi:hypothetical protein GCM10027084_05460 [Pseudoxanthomonas sangjuensis]
MTIVAWKLFAPQNASIDAFTSSAGLGWGGAGSAGAAVPGADAVAGSAGWPALQAARAMARTATAERRGGMAGSGRSVARY